jgi:KipI family sensor histidine kinase inhibitor
MAYVKPVFHLMGDRSLLVEVGDKISPAVNRRVQKLFAGMDLKRLKGVHDLVPGYRSLMVTYDPLSVSVDEIKKEIMGIYSDPDQYQLPEPRIIKIPVVYGDDYGPDLESVARYHNITPEEVIVYHTRPVYRVYMIGFTPGYPYLGEVPDAIATPRRETPRTLVPSGSVGIAQKQSGIYPVDSPGGWQIIGWTPVKLFDPQAQPPSLLVMGDQVQFQAITAQEAVRWQS